eukprot:TRINITY_DN1312_c0_g1_i9.p7 TRINITY_DN1312_c0_g1~~TRINITY_DN1312_c0_g1_i9.p7  ORF type:complete len:188 (-),score=6.10 TRINITY_DN1312_c0_g1_i9:276-839(-)
MSEQRGEKNAFPRNNVLKKILRLKINRVFKTTQVFQILWFCANVRTKRRKERFPTQQRPEKNFAFKDQPGFQNNVSLLDFTVLCKLCNNALKRTLSYVIKQQQKVNGMPVYLLWGYQLAFFLYSRYICVCIQISFNMSLLVNILLGFMGNLNFTINVMLLFDDDSWVSNLQGWFLVDNLYACLFLAQ